MSYTAGQRAAYSARIRTYERTDVWGQRAARFRVAHGNFCDACLGHYGGNVDVHHRSYDRAFGGREPDGDLRALCRDDHEAVHRLTRDGWNLADATDFIIDTRRGTDAAEDARMARAWRIYVACLIVAVLCASAVWVVMRSV